MAYGIVLVIDEPAAQDLVAEAQRIISGRPAVMVVGPAAPPHVTLLHARCDDLEAGSWWHGVRDHLGPMHVEPIGLMTAVLPPGDFYVPDGGTYFGLEVFRTQALADAHDAVLSGAAALGLEAIGRVGEYFRPHVTLGVLERSATDIPIVDVSRFTGRLSGSPVLGRLGPHGTFPHIVQRL